MEFGTVALRQVPYGFDHVWNHLSNYTKHETADKRPGALGATKPRLSTFLLFKLLQK